MLCILCLTISNQVIEIFDERGTNLNVSSIIVKHFWLQPSQKDANSRIICCSCWNALDSFHKFYEKVEAAHLNLLNTATATEENLKEEDESDVDNFEACSDFLSADVKLEVKEDGFINLQKDDLPDVKQTIDSLEIFTDAKHSDSDSDSEVPLATLAKRSKSLTKDTPTVSSVIDNSEPKLSPSAENDYNSDCKTNKKQEISCDSDYQAAKPKARTKKARRTKERKTPQSKSKSESDETRVKRKIIDPVKKRELSKEFDEVIQKNMKLSCNICHIPLANFFLLRKHYHSVHNERGYATCCGRKFPKRGILVDHIYLHLNPEYFKCEKCDRVMADRRGLEVHMNTHDISKKRRIYQCDECNKSFYRKLLLDRHKYTHIPDRKFNCEECQKLFSSDYTLRQHINNVHNIAYMKICEQCGKSVRGLEQFRRHQLEHAGIPIPLVQCEKCGVKLTTKYGLKRHMDAMHPETKVLHVCKVCGKIAPSAAALQRHTSYMHKCERNHKCPMCDKAFKKPGGLRVIKTTIDCLCTPNQTVVICSLKPSAENANDKVICASCWKELDSFHKFYQKVEEAHSKLISTWSAATVGSTDILSAAIRIAGIKQEFDEESVDMETSSSEDESDYEEENNTELKIRRTPKKELDQVIKQHMKLKCNICQEPMRNFYMLKRHFESVHNESGYVICCKLKFKKRSTLADHIYLDHNLVYLCDKCGQVMADCRALNVHKATHSNCLSTINVTSAVTLRFEKTVQTSHNQ